MTFDDIVDKVKKKLNLTSTDATDRIGERVNEVYRTVTSSIGLETSRRVEAEITYNSGVDLDLPYITVPNMEKILTVRLQIADSRPKILGQKMYDDVKNYRSQVNVFQDPRMWAVFREDYNSVTIIINAFPDAEDFVLEFEGLENAATLATTDIPAFPESFHDIIVNGAVAEELMKMEKPALADIAAKRYEQRLSDLRYFLAKSQWLDVVQGKMPRRYIRGSTISTLVND